MTTLIFQDFDDNIVAFWEPAVLPIKGTQADYEYTIHWTDAGAPAKYPRTRVAATRIGEDQSYPGTHVFVVDFKGEEAENVAVEKVIARIGAPSELLDSRVIWNPYTESWRATLRVKSVADEAPPIEIDCQLVFDDESVSEVWNYQWTH